MSDKPMTDAGRTEELCKECGFAENASAHRPLSPKTEFKSGSAYHPFVSAALPEGAEPHHECLSEDFLAMKILETNYTWDRPHPFIIRPKVAGYEPAKTEWKAISYLCDEWDWGYDTKLAILPSPGAQPPSDEQIDKFSREILMKIGCPLGNSKDFRIGRYVSVKGLTRVIKETEGLEKLRTSAVAPAEVPKK